MLVYQVGAVVLAVAGIAMAVVGGLGLRVRLPRNRFAGVRTVNTLRDEHTFAVGNQAAAPLTIAAGVVALLGAVAVWGAPSRPLAITLLALATLGTLALTVAGGVLGDRVAKRIPPATVGGCSGVCAGCDLVAGCKPTESSETAAS